MPNRPNHVLRTIQGLAPAAAVALALAASATVAHACEDCDKEAVAVAMAAASSAAPAAAPAAALPYDEKADARADVQAALAAAQASGKPVVVVFGANWCPDCRALDKALKNEPNAALMASSFHVVKVDVGRFDRNLDIAKAYGDAIKKGIPAAAVLSPKGELLYATKAGELGDARKMSDQGVYDFFVDVRDHKAKPAS